MKFEGKMRPVARPIAPPVANAFFNPVRLPASFVTGFFKTPGAEHFAIGDRYDLMLGNGLIATVKLTTLVGCETDEEVGNDSFVGALAAVERPDDLLPRQNYYALRRHHESQDEKTKSISDYTKFAGLLDTAVRFDIESQIVELLSGRMRAVATDAEKRLADGVFPALKLQPFQLADGSLRYYARVTWNSGKENEYPYALGAWISPLPTLHILAAENRTNGYGDLPDLLNVVDLGGGRTGLILELYGDDSIELRWAEYRDELSVEGMPVLHFFGTGE